MNLAISNRKSVYLMLAPLLFAPTILFTGAAPCIGQEKLSLPLPRTATNGALHYQRAILYLLSADPAHTAVLQKPIWEIINSKSTDADIAKLDALLVETRHAVRAALVGANQMHADFGLDIRQYMLSTTLPHAHPMVQLARLNTLHGIQREAQGNWAEAAMIHLATLRMGKHMAEQLTLDETLAGIEMLETAYFALGRWATRCPDTSLVRRASELAAASSGVVVDPARTLQTEAAIYQMRLESLLDAFPDGPWEEMVLESSNETFDGDSAQELKAAAIAAATKRGVPNSAFENKESFERYMTELRSTYVELARESAACLALSPPESIIRGEEVFEKFKPKMLKNETESKLNPARVAALFAVHDAELTLTRLILAISAAKTESGFPIDLSGVQNTMGGELPASPYNDAPLVYESLDGGKGFSLAVPAAKIGTIELPEIKFMYQPDETGMR